METFELGMFQRAVIENARCAKDKRPTKVRIAEIAGCCDTEIGRFESGARAMTVDELINLCDEYGDSILIDALRARRGIRGAPQVDVTQSTIRALTNLAALFGEGTPEERTRHARAAQMAISETLAALEPGRRG